MKSKCKTARNCGYAAAFGENEELSWLFTAKRKTECILSRFINLSSKRALKFNQYSRERKRNGLVDLTLMRHAIHSWESIFTRTF